MAQVIKRNRRRNHRRHLPHLSVQVSAGEVFITRDWSLGGLRIDGLATTRQPGEPVVGSLRHGAANTPWHRFIGSVVRIDEDQTVSIRFEDLSPGCFELLQSLLLHPQPDEP
jgi:hypothetical protein